MDLRKCYQIIGISRDCTWDELRSAYRRQIQKHHPDRFQQQPEQQLIAKERTLELNKAFDILEEYYRKNGKLPTDALKSSAVKSQHQTRTEETTSKAGHTESNTTVQIKPAKPKQSAPKTSWGLVIVIALLGYIIFWENTPQSGNSHSYPSTDDSFYGRKSKTLDGVSGNSPQDRLPDNADNAQIHTRPRINANSSPSTSSAPLGMESKIHEGPFFTFGDTPGKVFEIQGIPTRTVGDTWFYGASEVHFKKGVVASWHNSPDHPLKVK